MGAILGITRIDTAALRDTAPPAIRDDVAVLVDDYVRPLQTAAEHGDLPMAQTSGTLPGGGSFEASVVDLDRVGVRGWPRIIDASRRVTESIVAQCVPSEAPSPTATTATTDAAPAPSATSVVTPTTRDVAADAGLTLPEGWRAAGTPVVPGLADPVERWTFLTGPTGDVAGNTCGPQSAIDAMGPDDAIVWVSERLPGPDTTWVDVWRDDIDQIDETDGRTSSIGFECATVQLGAHEVTQVAFLDAARQFEVFVVTPVGDPDRALEAWRILNMLEFEHVAPHELRGQVSCPGNPPRNGDADGLPRDDGNLSLVAVTQMLEAAAPGLLDTFGATEAFVVPRGGEVWQGEPGMEGVDFDVVTAHDFQLAVTVRSAADCPADPSSFGGVGVAVGYPPP